MLCFMPFVPRLIEHGLGERHFVKPLAAHRRNGPLHFEMDLRWLACLWSAPLTRRYGCPGNFFCAAAAGAGGGCGAGGGGAA
jgi:hypothetical protein